MMEIRVYNQDLMFQGITENQTSITWTRKYFEAGNFEIYVPITADNVKLFKINNIVWIPGAAEAGIIENLKFTHVYSDNKILASGRFLESYMDRRVIHPKVNFSGKTEVGMRTLIESVASIPHVELGELQGYDEDVSFQCSWKSLLSMETKLAQSSSLGFRFRPNFTDKIITFEVYKGLDRTRSQHDRSFVEFSEDFDNLNEATFTENNQLEKNVAYVLGEGEGADRKMVIVGDDTLAGYARRELYVDARDLTSEDLTDAQYEEKLRQRGLEKLEENALSKSFECVTIPMGNFVYKRDYDLGDIVTTKQNNWNISSDFRITEIMEVYEHGLMEVIPTLGNPLPTTLDMED